MTNLIHTTLRAAVDDAKSQVKHRNVSEKCRADGDYSVFAQRTDGWNTKTRRIVVAVYRGDKKLLKAEWEALL